MTRKARKRLTQAEYDALLEAQGGVCCVSGCEATGPFEGEHSTPHWFDPGHKPDQLMCIECHKKKTAEDKKKIGKTKRLIRQQKEGRSRPRRGRPLATRPFPKKERAKWKTKNTD